MIDQNIKLVGLCRYKGVEYYAVWIGNIRRTGEHKARLTTLDGQLDFWVKCLPGIGPYQGIDGNGDTAIILELYPQSPAKTLKRIKEQMNVSSLPL